MLAAIRAHICAAVLSAALLVTPFLMSDNESRNHSQPSTFQKAQYPAIYVAAHCRRSGLHIMSLSSSGITTITPAPFTKSNGSIKGMSVTFDIQELPSLTFSAITSKFGLDAVNKLTRSNDCNSAACYPAFFFACHNPLLISHCNL